MRQIYLAGGCFWGTQHLIKQLHGVIDTETAYNRPLAVEVAPLINFYAAEPYHQDYLDKHPDGYCHIPHALIEEARKIRN